MNKKLMAVAVAGALAAPALALAQGSTVQIYGTLKAEYGRVSMPKVVAPGTGYNSWDGLNSGSSNIGFRGEEKLGGGMSAFFQCESDLRFLGGTTRTSGSLCDRNSALGLKGGFGSVFVGTWDSPDKLAVGKTRISEDTGWFGVTHMLLGESNRTAHSINYHSPNFNGFTFAAQTSSTNAASNTLSTPTPSDRKGRANSFNVIYDKGPLAVAFGYTQQDDVAANQGGLETFTAAQLLTLTAAEDKNMSLGATYTFGPAKVGLTYTKQDVSGSSAIAANRLDADRNAWNLAGTYKLGGPGSIWAAYTKAGDVKGTDGGVLIPGKTGAKEYQIGYAHDMSKRTSMGIGYARVKNDTLGDYTVGGTAATAGINVAGFKTSVIAAYMFHRF